MEFFPVGQRIFIAATAAAVLLTSVPSDARPRRQGKRRPARKSVATFSHDYASAPAYRYANLAPTECYAELDKRKVTYTKVTAARGVTAPVRIPDGVGGVSYRTGLPRAKAGSSPWEVFDCRLVVALHDFSAILVKHRIDAAIIYSAWRPPPKSWPVDKQARRHPGALAIDIDRLRQRVAPPSAPAATATATATATTSAATKAPVKHVWLDVEDHFNGKIGSGTCGPQARPPSPATSKAKELRAIVCETADARLFSSMLTPNYNKAHFNHFHFELTQKVKWRIVR